MVGFSISCVDDVLFHLQIRTDCFKLLRSFQRPNVTEAKGIGIWQDILDMYSQLAVVVHAAFVAIYLFFIRKEEEESAAKVVPFDGSLTLHFLLLCMELSQALGISNLGILVAILGCEHFLLFGKKVRVDCMRIFLRLWFATAFDGCRF